MKWDLNGTTFADLGILKKHPRKVLVTDEDTIYVVCRNLNRVLVWFQGVRVPGRDLSDRVIYPESIFVTTAGDIYVNNHENNVVNKWTSNSTNSVLRLSINGSCFDVFVDIDNHFYCSVSIFHQVIKRAMNHDDDAFK